MKIISCCKIVPNEEEIFVLPNRELSLTEASFSISQYDLNALESAKRLASETKGSVVALSIGSSKYLENTKIQKDILSRGADELVLVTDDIHEYSDSLQTAKSIAKALEELDYDLVLCGAGSNDLYSQVVGTQAGTLLHIPTINNITKIEVVSDGQIEVERTLENEIEILRIQLPAILSVSSEINIPSVPNMREIMKAGKKPVNKLSFNLELDSYIAIQEQLAPEQQERRQEIIENDDEESVDLLFQFLKKEGF